MSEPSSQFDSAILQEHAHDIEEIVRRLRAFYDVPNVSGLAHIAVEWNRLLKQSMTEGSANQRELLKQEARWYLTLDEYEQNYRRQLDKFLDRVRGQPNSGFERTSFAHRRADDAIGRLELALSEVSGTINLAMPDHVRHEAQGAVILCWHDRDKEPNAELFWEAKGQRIALRKAIYSGLRHSARLGHEDVSFLTGILIDEIRNVHKLELPEFHYQAGLQPDQPPTELLWKKTVTRLADAGRLPDWMAREESAPEQPHLELPVGRRDPKLAELIDPVLCAAALEDQQAAAKLTPAELAQRVCAVEELVAAVARGAGVPREEVASLFAPALVDRQPQTKSAEECAANTNALHFLLAQLTEQ